MKVLLSALMLLIVCESFAQLSRKEKKAARQSSGTLPTTLDPGVKENKAAVKRARKKEKSDGITYNSQKEFEDRMDARAKTYRKNEKYLTPQYANPAYFGHKRPPKKRPANKMKFCKECGIRH